MSNQCEFSAAVRYDVVSADANWNWKTCKAPVSSPPVRHGLITLR